MDSLGSPHAFVQAAEARSFTVAGRQLGVSSSGIGKAVARMEERLGVRLLHRSTRSITLTAEGALFLERCRRIFSEIEAAELELSKTHEAPRGTLRVSLPLVGMLMMPTLVAFMRAYPEIILDLDFSDRYHASHHDLPSRIGRPQKSPNYNFKDTKIVKTHLFCGN